MILIQIQYLGLILRIRIQGFDDQKFEKKITAENLLLLSFSMPPYRKYKLQKKPLALKREHHQALQNMIFLNFFQFLWVIFALLDPDPEDPLTWLNLDPNLLACREEAQSTQSVVHGHNHYLKPSKPLISRREFSTKWITEELTDSRNLKGSFRNSPGHWPLADEWEIRWRTWSGTHLAIGR
jgi:hypothetical protein